MSCPPRRPSSEALECRPWPAGPGEWGVAHFGVRILRERPPIGNPEEIPAASWLSMAGIGRDDVGCGIRSAPRVFLLGRERVPHRGVSSETVAGDTASGVSRATVLSGAVFAPPLTDISQRQEALGDSCQSGCLWRHVGEHLS